MDATAKREAIQAIMKDTSLTPQEKQKRMLELNKAATPASAKAPSSQSTTKSAEPNPAADDDAAKRKLAIQGIMKDTTLTPLERQAKIQKLMKGGKASGEAPETTTTSSTSERTTSAAASASSPSSSNQARQELVRSLMRDTTLSAQEKQKRIKAITARSTGPTRSKPAMEDPSSHSWGSPTAVLAAAAAKKSKEEAPKPTPKPAPAKEPEKTKTAAEEALARYSFGAPTAAFANKMEEDYGVVDDKTASEPSHSYGSPSAMLVEAAEAKKSKEEKAPTPIIVPPQSEKAVKTEESKPNAALAARISMGALSPTAVLTSATSEDFSHIRRPDDTGPSQTRPDPMGIRKSQVSSVTAASAPKPKKEAPAPVPAKPKVPAPAPKREVPLAARSSVAVTKQKGNVPTKKMTSAPKTTSEAREPASTSRALPGLSDGPAAAPRSILKTEPDPPEAACCVIL
jgi:hypothetical protein